jgi:hypothetical protein
MAISSVQHSISLGVIERQYCQYPLICTMTFPLKHQYEP